MIIGADGQHSTVRTSVQGKRVEPQATETVVFTGHIPMKRLLDDDLLEADKFAFSWVYWFGPRRAVLGALIVIDISVPMPCCMPFTTF
jgi:2-polyprenyl-6-methoxyphenol hydroxylase-like FAD-dependent oxidoreductase